MPRSAPDVWQKRRRSVRPKRSAQPENGWSQMPTRKLKQPSAPPSAQPATTATAAANGADDRRALVQKAARRFEALNQKAATGDQAAVLELRQGLQRTPDLIERAGNASAAATAELIRLVSGELPWRQEATRLKLEELRREFAPVGPLEAMLVERILMCWLQASYEDYHYAALIRTGGTPWESATAQQKLAERAGRRLQSAIKSLAQVRKLGLPAIQINVGEKQVNIGSLKLTP